MERKVDNQVAAPAETRTPNWHRANQTLLEECGWKGGDSGDSAGENLVQRKNKRTHLTPTGLLMEGDYTNYPWTRVEWPRAHHDAQERFGRRGGAYGTFLAVLRVADDGWTRPLLAYLHAATRQGAHRKVAGRNSANQCSKPSVLARGQKATGRTGARAPPAKVGGNPRRIAVAG